MVEATPTIAPRPLSAVFPGVRWTMPERLPIAQWVESKRRVSDRYSAAPGPYSLSRFPHWREVLEACADPAVREVDICASVQSGKTAMMDNLPFYFSDNDARPMLWCFPGENQRNDWVEQRFRPTLDCSPGLAGLVKPGQGGINQERIDFFAAPLFLVVASSEASMASKPVGLVIADEIGKYPTRTAKEGSPLDQLRARVTTFPLSLVVVTSTPTGERDGIWPEYLLSDMREWNVRCPECLAITPWQRANIGWAEKPAGKSVNEWAGEVRRNDALSWWQCPACEKRQHGQLAKHRMNASGFYVGRGYPLDRVGFHIHGLASPFISFGTYASGLMLALDAQEGGNEEPIKTFTQHTDARPWAPKKTVMADDAITARVDARLPHGRLPHWCKTLTCGIDVQHSGVYFVISAWGNDAGTLRRHVVDHGFAESFDAMDLILDRAIQFADGRGMRIVMGFVDSSDGTTKVEVYRWTAKRKRQLRPIKGQHTASGGKIWREADTKKNADHGGRLINIWPDESKDFMAAQLASGTMTFHEGVGADADFQTQMASQEKREIREPGKKPRFGWAKKEGHKDDHYWDAANYDTAVAFFLGLARNDHRWRQSPATANTRETVVVNDDGEVERTEAPRPVAPHAPAARTTNGSAFGRRKSSMGNSF